MMLILVFNYAARSEQYSVEDALSFLAVHYA
jgi:hypothetical protein